MKTIIVTAIAVIVMLTSCGSEGGAPAGDSSTQAPGPTCPTGSWRTYSGFATTEVSVGNTGLINITSSDCTTTGYVTCTSANKFIMDLIVKEETGPDVTDCQALGTWECEYSVSAQVVTIFCPKQDTGNLFSPALDFSRY